jgi:hypothetical protein
MEDASATPQESHEVIIARLRRAHDEAVAEAVRAHEGLFRGETTDDDLDRAYRAEAEAKAALDKQLAKAA